MATYVVGDIHGCYDALMHLLDYVDFKQDDVLWCTGDLVNGGSKPAATIRFLRSLGDRCISVLGNHDVMLLTAGITNNNIVAKKNNYGVTEVLEAGDCQELMEWLLNLPLVHYDRVHNALLVHAGVLPSWDLLTILQHGKYAKELLLSEKSFDYLSSINSSNTVQVAKWREDLSPQEKLHFLLNVFTRMRFCYADETLDFQCKHDYLDAVDGLIPWFCHPNRAIQPKIFFGHWSALQLPLGKYGVFALDFGCVWGKRLSAYCLENNRHYTIQC